MKYIFLIAVLAMIGVPAFVGALIHLFYRREE